MTNIKVSNEVKNALFGATDGIVTRLNACTGDYARNIGIDQLNGALRLLSALGIFEDYEAHTKEIGLEF